MTNVGRLPPIRATTPTPTTTNSITSFPTTTRTTPSASSTAIFNDAYGRGADIWPESNNDAITLSDSFPNGIVPNLASTAIETSDAGFGGGEATSPGGGNKPRRRYIQRILKRAASRDTSDNETERGDGPVGKIPIALALCLLVGGTVRPMDVALVASWTAYLTILNMTARSTRENGGGAPLLPAVPPQGHVPALLSNPMGNGFERSAVYRRWLKLGALLGFVGPLAWLAAAAIVPFLMEGAPGADLKAARVVARPLFLLCCQVTTEAVSKRNVTPLPLRILVPIVYNASRLAYLWSWALAATNGASLGRIGRGLAIANAAYWATNLFAFLIPIASVRYMRAHFFGVEAEEVTTRIGLEETVGIIPNN